MGENASLSLLLKLLLMFAQERIGTLTLIAKSHLLEQSKQVIPPRNSKRTKAKLEPVPQKQDLQRMAAGK